MKKSELVLIALSVAAAVMRWFSIGGGILFSTFFFLLLALFYLFGGLFVFNAIPLKKMFSKAAYRDLTGKRVVGSVLTGIAFALLVPGLLFALNHWPGADVLLKTGMILLVIIAATGMVIYISKSSRFLSGILIRSGVLLLMSLVALLYY